MPDEDEAEQTHEPIDGHRPDDATEYEPSEVGTDMTDDPGRGRR